MQATLHKRIIGIATIVVVLMLVIALTVPLILRVNGSERYFSGDAEAYCEALIEKGFPKDYAVSLTELHLLHPAWEFTPLLITEEEPQYTWDYVIDKETEHGETNVIYSNSQYASYHHPFNRELYDAGYYQASRATVEYFMDPRNFLNETDIFQFYTLSGGDENASDAVEAILKGTFMENAVLENGMTYASYFVTLGAELGIDPVFLAAKVRQEQGSAGRSPLISGTCGSKLWEFYRDQTQKTDSGQSVNPPSSGYTQADLVALDGYYNYFNIGATGTGVFKIYYNAMQYAKKGTDAMRDAWDGAPSWNTRQKALYGGAYFLKTGYIDCYQSTVYLQKFNVDSRASTNFIKQYMTAVFGAMSEGRALYQSFASLDALDAPATFLIPVYGNMPISPSADPSGGRVQTVATATDRYDDRAAMTSPQRLEAKNGAIYTSVELSPNATLELTGSFSRKSNFDTPDYRVEKLEYAWDGGAWQTASDSDSLNLSLVIHFPENSSHILTVRGQTTYTVTRNGTKQTVCSYALYAVVYVNVVPPPSVTLSYRVGNTLTEHSLTAGSTVTLPTCETSDFAGWHGSDGTFLPSGADFVIESDVTYAAVFLSLQSLRGASIAFSEESPALCFSAALDAKAFRTLTETSPEAVSLSASLSHNGQTEAASPTVKSIQTSDGKEWLRLDVHTSKPIAPDTDCRAAFYAELHYTDGTTATLSTADTGDTRSLRIVAQAALADATAGYSEQMRTRLSAILGNE